MYIFVDGLKANKVQENIEWHLARGYIVNQLGVNSFNGYYFILFVQYVAG